MHLSNEDEDVIDVINDFKVTWFTLLSRVDAGKYIC